MAKFYELEAKDVRNICPLKILPFQTTAELEPLEDIIGQERAVNSMEYGLKIQKEGYNIFVVGTPGTGKNTYAQAVTQHIAETKPVPDDCCYIYNFEHQDQPLALFFPKGEGKKFVQRMEKLLQNLIKEIPQIFESEDYERRKNYLYSNFQNTRDDLMDELEKFAKDKGFILQEKKTGIITMPSIDERPITEEEYDRLSDTKKNSYQEASEEIQEKAMEIFRKIRQVERNFKEMLDSLNQMMGNMIVDNLFSEYLYLYRDFTAVKNYLQAFKEDVLESLSEFRTKESSGGFSFLKEENDETRFLRYQVNLFIDNGELKGAPVIYEANPTFYRLMGKVEYVSKVGSLVTSFLQIKPGAIHRANGGYLILSIRDLLLNAESWLALKRALKTGEIQIENLADSYGLVAVSSIRPAPIPLKLKVILLGNQYLYNLLLSYDEDYHKLFKIKVDFAEEMERCPENILKFAQFIKSYTRKNKMLPFEAGAVAELIDYSSRLAEDQEKMTTRFHLVLELVNEAETWARLKSQSLVTRENIHQAFKEKNNRNNKTEEKIRENINKGSLLIQCSGKRIGQVNALVVLDFGDHIFGYPIKVSSVAYRGRRGVIHIERETKMSGAIHDKGLMILTNFLGARYAQEHALNLSASLTFEQVYSGIEGDSASCAELIALLSSIAGIPLYQSIAITGSVNQYGEVQPIGGVTQKVEGFFKTCQDNGLTGDQGVIIPDKNIKNLMLDRDVLQAIERKEFHIYPIKKIDDGIEILTGIPAGHLRSDGTFPKNTVNYLVQERLKNFAKRENKEKFSF